ncbi:aldo/keto reductase [Rhodovarius lipocyclicus]|uniref:aldo/keto reductase n=1 Tax=Rhodovarius lipocyclicus TaxID=268410 RepID=UPI001359A088|nr:aldo/keto reductase [Rhodovarius lipocyclicus]
MTKTVTWADGRVLPALGLGTWKMGEDPRRRQEELAALRAGLDAGLTLIDTAEMYGEGAAESLIAEALAGRKREEVFLVSKVYPHNAGATRLPQALARSLKRLKTDVLDCYLLHWRDSVPLEETAEAMERMRAAGHIRGWGVSNLDVEDMEELADPRCATNQVLLHPGERGVEFDLLPWMQARGMPLMAYSPLGQGPVLRNPALGKIAARHGATAAQVALAWSISHPGVIAIPKSGRAARAAENAKALELELTAQDLAEIDAAFPPPRRKRPLAML